MIIYVITSTDRNYTLIPQTNAAIIAACQKLSGDICHVSLGQDTVRDHNFIRQLVEHNQRGEEYLIFDVTGKNTCEIGGQKFIRNRLSYISDAPYTIWPNIIDMESRSIITYSDKGDVEFLRDIGYEKPAFFMPHGGPEVDCLNINFDDRDIDLLMIGRIENETSLIEIAARLGTMPFNLLTVLQDAFERAVMENIQPYKALKLSTEDKGISLFDTISQESLLNLLSDFYSHVEMANRNKLLSSLHDIKLDIIGPVRGDVEGVCDVKHNFHGPKYGDECLGYMKRAKVVLNSVSVFPQGSHERIWFAMAHGAAVFTDNSEFVADSFNDNESILFIDNKDHDRSVDNLRNALETQDKLNEISRNAIPIYASHHTWDRRLAQVLPKVGTVIANETFNVGPT